ncbi:DUF927 domain-containing protein [Crenobacter sp. HX-7-9]|uniref:DUF927 domain-containing protein n=1 Tax=Crenobacter caeni TaxID=2705474 RepID=A0A6B2KQS6_9NEIS|nr:DUF927 domain-containing protein [Crenobacter caeni]NDV12484.1 DUF927 domain-containing protein [Crenobacter caeni]
MSHYDHDELASALACLDPHDRDEWVTMAMACKAALGEDGFPIWDNWSQGADNYRTKDARAVWKSVKAGGRVTARTLYHAAKAKGWQPSRPIAPPSPEELARIEDERAAARQEAEALQQAQREAAKAKAAKLWALGRDVSATHPYLVSKGTRPYGARQLRDMLLVPLRVDGELVNLQIISSDGSKRFLTGGQVKGTSLALGWQHDPQTVLLCEGWATGCTLQEATGLPVVVAFNAGNLKAVAERMATSLAETLRVLVCGDTDTSGTGQEAASQAAAILAPRGEVVLPEFSQAQIERHQHATGKAPSDFNDLHQLAGLESVRDTMLVRVKGGKKPHFDMSPQVLEGEKPPSALPDTQKNANIPKIDANHANHANQPQEPNNGEGSSNGGWFAHTENANANHANQNTDKPAVPYGYLLKQDGSRPGVYWLDPEGDKPPRWLCSPLIVDAKTRDGNGSNWGRLLVWFDAEGRLHEWAMPAELPHSDGGALAQELARGGLDVEPGRKARELLTAYIVKAAPQHFARCTQRTGWHDGVFVLHGEVIGAKDGERVILQSDRDESIGMAQAGTLECWRDEVAALASGNSRMVFALSLAFAAPLAELANESGGFHIVGGSSAGKSTALEAAASVWGHPAEYGFKWRATSNGLEGMCASRNDLLVILDELAQVDPREAGEAAYMIANGQGKARSDRTGAIRTPRRWRTLMLSAGEINLSQHMREAGKHARAGQEVRLIDIAADAGAGLGLFDTLAGSASGADLSMAFKRNAAQHYGHAGRAFLRRVVEDRAAVLAAIREGRDSIIAEDVPRGAAGQVLRAAGRFALVAVAGELATAYGLTGWPPGEAMHTAVRLFHEWLAARGGAGDAEVTNGLLSVRAFIEQHGESRFTPWDADPETAARTINRAGFRRTQDDGLNYYVLPSVFRGELCKGFNAPTIARAMVDKGWLKTQREDRCTYAAKLPGMGNKKTEVYLIGPAILEDAA